MRFLFASDSFKGSLSSDRTITLLTDAAKEVFGDVECIGVPVADGGEGTVNALVKAENGSLIREEVNDPLMRPVAAEYGRLDECRAVIEMASASGLTLISNELRNPLNTTSFGTGELIRRALDADFRDITVAIGGSATNDGGMGCARALGVRFLDGNGNELEGRGRDLIKVSKIDLSGMDKRIADTKITVMCDVNNPLCGERGATYTFGPQKGADEEALEQLEAGMRNYRDVIRRQFDIDPDAIKGAGAAGGLGTALKVFLGGEMKPGIDTVLDLIDFDRRLEGIDLVITGEGRADVQSCYGKVMQGVAKRAKAKGIPVVGLCGSLGDGYEKLYEYGIDSLMTTLKAPMLLEEAMENAQELYYDAAVRMFRLIKTGMNIRV